MRHNIQQRKSGGFTIIEVMIVLAIAGLIMLIVFLAVPALQRSSRNTSRKNDAGRIGTAASEFVSNNNGTLPSTAANATSILNSAGSLGGYTLTTGAVGQSVGKLGVSALGAGSTASLTGTIADNTVVIYTAAQCGTAGQVKSGSSRQMAMLYSIENNSGFTGVCQNI